jgi:hypothetical protein
MIAWEKDLAGKFEEFLLTLQVHFNLVVYTTRFKCSDVTVKQIYLNFSSQILSPFPEQLSLDYSRLRVCLTHLRNQKHTPRARARACVMILKICQTDRQSLCRAIYNRTAGLVGDRERTDSYRFLTYSSVDRHK